ALSAGARPRSRRIPSRGTGVPVRGAAFRGKMRRVRPGMEEAGWGETGLEPTGELRPEVLHLALVSVRGGQGDHPLRPSLKSLPVWSIYFCLALVKRGIGSQRRGVRSRSTRL